MDWHHVNNNVYRSDGGEIHICNHECSAWIFRQDGLKICAISGRCVSYGRGKLGGNAHLKRRFDDIDMPNSEHESNNCKSGRGLNKIHSIQKRRSFSEKPNIQIEEAQEQQAKHNWDEPTYGAGVYYSEEDEDMEME